MYSFNWDAIGYELKAGTIGENANTAVYKANLRYVYLIKDIHSGKNFKLQFFSYKNQEGVKGYPLFSNPYYSISAIELFNKALIYDGL